jgi:beta-xylosidase
MDQDGWFKAKGGDLSAPLPMPKKGKAVQHNFAKSDDFKTLKFGVQWSFFNPGPDEMKRVQHTPGALAIKGKGTSPVDSSPLTFITGDRAYEASITLDIGADAEGGLLLHYNERAYVGISHAYANENLRALARAKLDEGKDGRLHRAYPREERSAQRDVPLLAGREELGAARVAAGSLRAHPVFGGSSACSPACTARVQAW